MSGLRSRESTNLNRKWPICLSWYLLSDPVTYFSTRVVITVKRTQSCRMQLSQRKLSPLSFVYRRSLPSRELAVLIEVLKKLKNVCVVTELFVTANTHTQLIYINSEIYATHY